jgi:signal transduction histidine kinase
MHRSTTTAENRLVVPILLPSGRDAPLVADILTRQGIEVAICTSMQTMLDYIAHLCGPFVIGEEALSGESLDRLAGILKRQPEWSDLPGIVLTSSIAGDVHIGDLAALRQVSLIRRPIRKAVFINLIKTAMEARQRQYQVRDMLADMNEMNQKLRSRTELLQKLSLELTQAENRERKRIARILHDDLQQMLASARLRAEMLFDDVSDATAPKVQTIYDILSQSMQAARSLSHELRPAFMVNGDLAAGLKTLAAQTTADYQFAVRVECSLDGDAVAEDLQTFIYRSVQELLLNCAKHAAAKHVTLDVLRQGTFIRVVMADDGRGCDPDSLSIRGGTQGGFGLFGIQERIVALGGSFDVHSELGKGCRFELRLPAVRQATAADKGGLQVTGASQ